ncbi:MAG: serine/threonine protein kinase [Firmicutes bacterium]|nr:serine/threonine protein kinase [Bacillota bacterium]
MTDLNKSNPSHLGSSDYDDEPTLASHDAQPQYARHTFPYPINRRYRCLGLLGQGSSGAVYKAFDSQLQREVALKFIHQDQLAERQRLLAEARVLAKLEHPHICKVYEVAEEGAAVYLVMSYIDGAHLNQWREQFSLQQRVRIIADIADALDSAHQQGIVHCDVKPANIVLRQGTHQVDAILVDFGIAHASHHSVTGVSGAGTESYMAPERLHSELNSAAPGPAIDIYALGATLRFILTGSHSSDMQALPTDLRLIIQHCLAVEPSQRYPSAAQLHADLCAWLEQRPISLRRSPVYVTQRLWARNRWFRATTIGVIIVSLASFSLFTSYQQTQHQRQLEQLDLSAQVVQREYQIESIYRAPQHDVRASLQALRADADRWYATAVEQPDWLAATHYAAAGRIYYQLFDNERALASLSRAWQLGDRSERTATTYALTINRFAFDAKRQARALPTPAQREQAIADALQTYNALALDILQQSRNTSLPRDYLRALQLYLNDAPEQALRVLRNAQFPHWFYQGYELQLQISEELAQDVLDGYTDGDYLDLVRINERAFERLTERVPSYMPAHLLRSALLLALQVTRENEHPQYRANATSWMDDLPGLYTQMQRLDPNHPEYLSMHARYYMLLHVRLHLAELTPSHYLQLGARLYEQSLRESYRRGWSDDQRINIYQGILRHYESYLNYLTNNGRDASQVLARYQVVLHQMPTLYRGSNFYMSLANAYASQARHADTYEARNSFFEAADEAYAEAQRRSPELLGIQANYARILNTWAQYLPKPMARDTRARAIDLISPVLEQAPNNVAVNFNYGTIYLDQAGLVGNLGDQELAADLMDKADRAMAHMVSLAPLLDIGRQRWADIYLFFNHLLPEPLSEAARFAKIIEILDLDNFSPHESSMSYVRYMELLQQRHFATQQAEYLNELKRVLLDVLIPDIEARGEGIHAYADYARNLLYLSLHTNDPAQQQAWLSSADAYFSKQTDSSLSRFNVTDTANITAAKLAKVMGLTIQTGAPQSELQAALAQLSQTCAQGIALEEEGFIRDMFLVEAQRIWALVEQHTQVSCAAPAA